MPYPGERVQVTGIYRSIHTFHRKQDNEHVLKAGQRFPNCGECFEVEYILLTASTETQEEPTALAS